jgi:3-phosphoshikimate 1-carboxyvinyltransferase
MTDPLPITPFTRPLDSSVALPGSKSITNRALILAALAEGTTHLEGALFSRDTRIMLAALEKLGFECTADEAAHTLSVQGEGGHIPSKSAELHVGNAGTAARFLTAFLALSKGGTYRLDGDPAMRERPMAGLLDALVELDAAEFEFHGEAGHFPFTLTAKGYNGGSASVDAGSSSQILSALLLAAPAGSAPVTLTAPGVRPSYVSLTHKVREAFGAAATEVDENGTYSLPAISYTSPGSYEIEPDLSAASYFLALTMTQGGSLKIPKLGADPLQGDAHFVDVLNHHGLRVDVENNEWTVSCSNPLDIQRGHREIDFNTISDTFLTYAAISPLLGGSVRICGIGHTRHQETDRIAGMATELSKLGQLVKEEDDALTIMIKPNELRARALKARSEGRLLTVDTYEDHRFAMSFAILGSFDLLEDGEPWLAINDPSCCAKTFPNFFEVLDAVRGIGGGMSADGILSR